jgi:hypothetical protein
VLLGGLGLDVLDGGVGDDIEIQLVADDPVKLGGDGAAFEWLVAHAGEVEGLALLDTAGSTQGSVLM